MKPLTSRPASRGAALSHREEPGESFGFWVPILDFSVQQLPHARSFESLLFYVNRILLTPIGQKCAKTIRPGEVSLEKVPKTVTPALSVISYGGCWHARVVRIWPLGPMPSHAPFRNPFETAMF